MEILREHTCREMYGARNVLTRAYVMGGPRMDTKIQFHALTSPNASVHTAPVGQTLKDTEKQTLERVLRRHNQNRSAAARELGIARSTLLYKMKKHGIE